MEFIHTLVCSAENGRGWRVEGGGWRVEGEGRSGEQIRERRGKKGEKGIEYYMGEGEGRR